MHAGEGPMHEGRGGACEWAWGEIRGWHSGDCDGPTGGTMKPMEVNKFTPPPQREGGIELAGVCGTMLGPRQQGVWIGFMADSRWVKPREMWVEIEIENRKIEK